MTTLSGALPPLDLPRLRAVPLFAGLSDEELQRLSAQMRRRSYRPDVTLFTQGDDGDKLFVILSGTIHVQRPTGSGRTVYLGLRGPGEHFGEMSLLDGRVRMADAVTASPCELLTLDRAAFQDWIRTSPPLAQAVIVALTRRLRMAADDMESRHELDVTGRLAEFLLQMRETEGETLPEGRVRLTRSRTHQQLADMIGTTRESITRALDDLRSIKAIRAEGRPTTITLTDLKTLEKRCIRW